VLVVVGDTVVSTIAFELMRQHLITLVLVRDEHLLTLELERHHALTLDTNPH
jgi:hypothetical protein